MGYLQDAADRAGSAVQAATPVTYKNGKIGVNKDAFIPGQTIPGVAQKLKGTVFDPGALADRLTGKAESGFTDILNTVKGTKLEPLALPELAQYKQAVSLGAAGKLNPSTIQQSPWMNLALTKQAAEQSKAADAMAQNQAAAMAQGRGGLIAKGGLRTGANENLALQGMKDLASGKQGLMTSGAGNRADIGIQGAKIGSDIGQFNAANTQNANQFNVKNALDDVARQNEANRYRYGEQMKFKGSNETANALARAGGGKK